MNDYDAGYKAGINWNSNWMPGGPFYCGKEDKEGIEANKKWKEGFKDGLVKSRYKSKNPDVKALIDNLKANK